MDNGDFIPDSQASDDFVPDSTLGTGPNSVMMNKIRAMGHAAGVVSNMAPWNKVSQIFPYVAGKEAEVYGRMGVPPFISASLTTPLAVAPAIAGTALGLEGLYNAPSSTVKGLMNTPQELGPEYEAQNQAIGVTRRIPQEGGAKPTFAPPENLAFTKQPKPLPGGEAQPLPSTMPIRYPSKPGDFMAYADNRLKFGTQLDPQELMDWQVKLQTDMSNGTIPRFDPTGKITTIFQQASDLKNRIQQTFNQIAEPRLVGADLPEGTMPTREGLNKAYGISSGQQNLQRGLKKVGTGARYTAEGAGALTALYAGAKKLLGP